MTTVLKSHTDVEADISLGGTQSLRLLFLVFAFLPLRSRRDSDPPKRVRPSALLRTGRLLLRLAGVMLVGLATAGKLPTPPDWGDQGNGTYKNPILMADYSDPDICRVGKNFYLVCSEFHFMGMPVLHSRDLVNWTIVGRIYDHIDADPAYSSFGRYGGGSWAPSIRYHAKKFYVYFCTPDEGLFMSTADKAEGPWAPLCLVKRVSHWEDPCPFWDDDGNAYLGHSLFGAGPIILNKMSSDGHEILDDGKTVYQGNGAEGTKLLKRNGWYYLLIPEGGVYGGDEVALRAKNIYGPYEKKNVLEQGSTAIAGPHQGGLVELDNGEAWFIHFQFFGALGRIAHLEPVQWVDDWPLMGTQVNGHGEPVSVFKKPNVGKLYPVSAPQSDDEFKSASLGLQWAWNHNPSNELWSLTERKGWLRLKSSKASDLWRALDTPTQKLMGRTGTATVKLDASGLADGQVAGLCHISNTYGWIGLQKTRGVVEAAVNINGQVMATRVIPTAGAVWLRTTMDSNNVARFSFSTNGVAYDSLKGESVLQFGYWKGSRLGLFTYHTGGQSGVADFDWFHYDYAGPKSRGGS